MGGGLYDFESRTIRSSALGYDTKSVQEIFKSKNINNAMNPHGIILRESRDSEEHPESLAVVVALDVTGSMGSVPHHLVKTGLPNLMDKVIKGGIKDPQVLFLAIGDHECDESPLQVGQFESSDELLDKWLTDVWLEGHGGGNAGESYGLAWYFAGNHTSIDCFEKRNKKGILFTIGDEPYLKNYPGMGSNDKYYGGQSIRDIMGDGQYSNNYSAAELLEKAKETYEVYHIHIRETASGSRSDREEMWGQLLSDHLLVAQHHNDVADIIADIVLKHGKDKITGIPTNEPVDKIEEETVL